MTLAACVCVYCCGCSVERMSIFLCLSTHTRAAHSHEQLEAERHNAHSWASPVIATSAHLLRQPTTTRKKVIMSTAVQTPQSVHAVTPASTSHFQHKVASNNTQKVQTTTTTVKSALRVVAHKKTFNFKTPRRGSSTNNNNCCDKAMAFIMDVHNFPCDVSEQIYSTPVELCQQIKAFLVQHGVSRDMFCKVALRGVNRKSLRRFLETKKATSIVYQRGWDFLERVRMFQGQSKSLHRLHLERLHPHGLQH